MTMVGMAFTSFFLDERLVGHRLEGHRAPRHLGFLHVSEHLRGSAVATHEDHGEFGLVFMGEFDQFRCEGSARRTPMGGEIHGHDLSFEAVQFHGLPFGVDEAFREPRLPVEVSGGRKRGSQAEPEHGNQAKHARCGL